MRRINIFLIIMTVALSLLLILVAASLIFSAIAPSSYQSSWMRQMWNGIEGPSGMGGHGMMGSGGYASSYVWLIPVGLIGIAAIGAVGAVFYLAFPEIAPVAQTREKAAKESSLVNSNDKINSSLPSQSFSAPQNPVESVSKTLTPEERKVLNVLIAHQGKYLQKYIRKEAGLSRLKTHRIIARFAERGIVSLKKSGNTNEVFLSEWLKYSEAQNPA